MCRVSSSPDLKLRALHLVGRDEGRVLAWLLGILIVVCIAFAAAWQAAPEQLRRLVERQGTEALGRTVRLQQLQFSLVPMRLTLQGLEVGGAAATGGPSPAAPVKTDAPPAGGASPSALLEMKRLELEVDPWSVWRREPEVKRLLVEGLSLQLERTASGSWSVDDLLRRFQPASPSPSRAGPPTVVTLRDVEFRGGRVRLDVHTPDGSHHQRHEFSDLQLSVPWWSNRPEEAQREVQARLSVRVNGAPLSLQARGWPHRAEPAVQARLDVSSLNLAPLWPWWPDQLPLRPQQGTLEAQITLNARQVPAGDWQWGVSGPVALNTLSVVNAQGAPMASWGRLEVGLQDVRPMEKAVHLTGVRLTGGQVHVRRDRQGVLEWAAVGGSAQSRQELSTSSAPAPAPLPSPSPSPSPGWDVRSGPVTIDGLQVHWSDQVPNPAVRARVSPLDLRIDQVSWPVRSPSAFEIEAHIEPPAGVGPGPRQPVRLALRGTASDEAARVSWRVGALALAPWQPYLATVLQPALQGVARADGELEWAAGQRPKLTASVRSFRLDDFEARFPAAASPPLAWKSLTVDGLKADLRARRVDVGQVTWQEPSVQAQRDSSGAVGLVGMTSLEALLVPPSPPVTGRGSKVEERPGGVTTAQEPDWRLSLGRLRVAAGRVDLLDRLVPSDREPGAPWSLNLFPVALELERLSWPPSPSPTSVRLEAQWPQVMPQGLTATPSGMAEEPAPPAVARLQGAVRLDSPAFQGTVQLERWPVQRFEPQWAHHGLVLPVRLARAELGVDSRLDLRLGPQGLQTSGEGALRVADVQIFALPLRPATTGEVSAVAAPQAPAASVSAEPTADELARWNLLQVDGLRWAVVPGQKPSVQAGLVRLSDFFARLQVTEAGRLNLQDVAAPRPGDASASAAQGSVQTLTARAGEPVTPGKTPAEAATPVVPRQSVDDAALEWSVDRTELVNGRVDFIDRFIRPNYAADLTELNGFLGRFESGSAAMAPLELKGRAARTALLEIRGAVNPTASPLMLDLSARATDLELAPLSPYGGKYVGYTIERGKLSVDLSYRIEADGRLEARNQIILNQLTFGERVQSPQATSLPVRLALALLADRNGVIDVNLPISGSINEPQFSLMGLVWRMIGNLLVKVVTAPFSWLAGPGTQDLSAIAFEPGTALLEAKAAQALDTLFRGLSDRPALRMTITGAADHEAELSALRLAGLEQRMAALLRREAARAGPTAQTGPAGASGPASAAAPALPARGTQAHTALLRRLYTETNLPNKPRNLLGMLTTPPAPQMEAMLLAAMPVNENLARELALQRALAVRDALIARGLPAERLFLAAPQVGAAAGSQPRPEARLAITGP